MEDISVVPYASLSLSLPLFSLSLSLSLPLSLAQIQTQIPSFPVYHVDDLRHQTHRPCGRVDFEHQGPPQSTPDEKQMQSVRGGNTGNV